MKLLFRAEKKDIIIFALFNILLLYLVSILVLNISSLSTEAVLHGLNPIPAFGKDYIGPTLIIYVLVLLAIIISVSKRFWDRDTGFGVSTAKKQSDGYSRWATDKEMKSELSRVFPNQEVSEYAGIPLMNNGKEIWLDDGEFHNLVIGSTGSGKTQTTVLPMVKLLAKKGESMVITDPKGEIYQKTADSLRKRDYKIIVLNFRDPDLGEAWNPLMLPYQLFKDGDQDKAIELIEDLAANIVSDAEGAPNDPFWQNTAAGYLVGLTLALFEDGKEDEINLSSINLMNTIGEERIMGRPGSNYIKEYFATKDPASSAFMNASTTINAPNETRGSIIAVFKQKINMFSTRVKLAEMLSNNSFNIKDIGENKTAVFVVIQDEKTTYHPLATIFLKQCYETLVDIATKNESGKLKYRTNFILDEFANMPALKDVTTMVTAARSRDIRFTFIIQNFAQLNQVYGEHNAETIKGNCGNTIYLISSELSALEEISKRAGEIKSKKDDKTSSTPLVTISDLQRLKMWDAVIFRTRQAPFKTTYTPNYMINWGEEEGNAPFTKRESIPIKLFDMKKFTDEALKNKKTEASSFNPFGGGMMPRPGINPPVNPENLGKKPEPPKNMNMKKLMDDIDKKLAEIASEDKSKKTEEKSIRPVLPVTPTTGSPMSANGNEKDSTSLKKSYEEKIEDITDDQFFDDFFGDD